MIRRAESNTPRHGLRAHGLASSGGVQGGSQESKFCDYVHVLAFVIVVQFRFSLIAYSECLEKE